MIPEPGDPRARFLAALDAGETPRSQLHALFLQLFPDPPEPAVQTELPAKYRAYVVTGGNQVLYAGHDEAVAREKFQAAPGEAVLRRGTRVLDRRGETESPAQR